MAPPSHILLGGVIGSITGDYATALTMSVLPDTDHFVSYLKSGVIFKPKEFLHTITSPEDLYGDQRGYLHNVVIAYVISLAILLVFPLIGLTAGLAYLGHLALDSLDNSDYWPLYPDKSINIRGPIVYFSRKELVFDLFLIVILLSVLLI